MTTNLQLAKEVSKHVELRSILLKNAKVESWIESWKTPKTLNITQEHRCIPTEVNEEGARFIKVLAEFRFVATAKEEAKEDADVANLEAAFVLTYGLPSDAQFDSKCLKHFADLNGVYNAWPYWRELVQTATGRIGLAGIMVPVYRPTASEVPDDAGDQLPAPMSATS